MEKWGCLDKKIILYCAGLRLIQGILNGSGKEWTRIFAIKEISSGIIDKKVSV